MAKRELEPLLWLLFSAGGVLSALLMPILILLFGVAIPLQWVDHTPYTRLLALLQNPLIRVAMMALCTLSLFHWAHRFRYTLYDGLQIKHLNEVINTLCYGGAIFGSLAAGYWLVRL